RADRQVDAAGDDHEGHADREDEQVGVVEQQRRERPRGHELAEVHLRPDEDQDEDHHGGERRHHRRVPTEERLPVRRDARPAVGDRYGGHGATSASVRSSGAVGVDRRPRVRRRAIAWTRGDWISTTMITTTAKNTGLSAAETPRNRIVDCSVWMM